MSDKNRSLEPHSPNWSTSTKFFIAAFTLVLIGLAVWQFQSLLATLVIAGIIAYILNAPIMWLDRYTPLSRGAAIGLVYPLFAVLVLGLLTAAGVTVYNQTEGLLGLVQQIVLSGPERFNSLLDQSRQFGPWQLDLNQLNLDLEQVLLQLQSTIQPLITQSAEYIGWAATTTVSWIGWALLIYILSIYFAIDLPRFSGLISDAVYQPGYRRDVERLLRETGRIWNGYLRGQTTLALIMVVIFTVTLSLLGVRNALALGILAGILDFIPYLGPAIMIGLSTLAALFQDGNWLGLNSIWFGVLVFTVILIIQQIEGNWLNPRIVGGALKLHPLLVMVGAIMGSTLAGILGVMLAAPCLAMLKLLGTYAWRKMFDLDPFPEPEVTSPKKQSAASPEQTQPQPATTNILD